jgi:hypothetical protein
MASDRSIKDSTSSMRTLGLSHQQTPNMLTGIHTAKQQQQQRSSTSACKGATTPSAEEATSL